MKLLYSALGLLLVSSVAEAKPLKVSVLEGSAHVLAKAEKHTKEGGPSKGAPWRALKKGATVRMGDAVKTGEKTRLELTLADGSRIRLGASSMMTLDAAKFAKGGERKVGITMWVGRIWAKVAKKLGSESKFEVQTANAVAGVRGTSFTVVAHQDLSAVVRVYSGTVGVKKTPARPGFRTRARVQIQGPTRVDKTQWEEIVATQMKQVTISALGKITPAEDFVDDGDELEWAMWNQKRDEAVQ